MSLDTEEIIDQSHEDPRLLVLHMEDTLTHTHTHTHTNETKQVIHHANIS